MINPKARRLLLLQQQLRILRRQQAVAAAPDYFEHVAAAQGRASDHKALMHVAGYLERDYGADPYCDARGAV
jgi:hypothetical protein